jgi:hypothetical protein
MIGGSARVPDVPVTLNSYTSKRYILTAPDTYHELAITISFQLCENIIGIA